MSKEPQVPNGSEEQPDDPNQEPDYSAQERPAWLEEQEAREQPDAELQPEDWAALDEQAAKEQPDAPLQHHWSGYLEHLKDGELAVLSGNNFLEFEIPPREVLLASPKSPILVKPSINVINASRGAGKTFTALALTRALATGGRFLNWKAPRQSRVLFVDGELPVKDMQDRWRMAVGITKDDSASLVTLDYQPKGILSLATEEGQNKLEAVIKKWQSEVLILDSVSTLFRIPMNEEEEVIKIQEWLMKLRSKFQLAVILLNHKGKNLELGPRGHSRIEDAPDLCIELDRPQGYKASDGLHCTLKFTKTRSLIEDAGPLEIKLETRDGQAVWTTTESLNDLKIKARELYAKGWTQAQIAEEVGRDQSVVSRWLK